LEKAFVRQNVTLVGGEKSDYYYDIKRLLLEPKAIHMFC
jgi:orotate phosphoribosyltransferase